MVYGYRPPLVFDVHAGEGGNPGEERREGRADLVPPGFRHISGVNPNPSGETPFQSAGSAQNDAGHGNPMIEIIDGPAGKDRHDLTGRLRKRFEESAALRVETGGVPIGDDGRQRSVEIENP